MNKRGLKGANGPIWMPQALKPLCLNQFWSLQKWPFPLYWLSGVIRNGPQIMLDNARRIFPVNRKNIHLLYLSWRPKLEAVVLLAGRSLWQPCQQQGTCKSIHSSSSDHRAGTDDILWDIAKPLKVGLLVLPWWGTTPWTLRSLFQGRWGHCDLRYCGNGGLEGSVQPGFGSGGGGGGNLGGGKVPSDSEGVATTNLDSNGKPCFTVWHIRSSLLDFYLWYCL